MSWSSTNRSRQGEPKPPAIRWGKLSESDRELYLGLAQKIVKRERARTKTHLGSNVRGIGVGFRTKGKNGNIRRELVVRVYVSKKLDESRLSPSRIRKIPPSFQTYVRGRGRRQVYRIPSDVVEVDSFSPQRTYVRVSNADTRETGSICCLLREKKSKDLFLLSCKHVFGLTSRTHGCAGSRFAAIDLVAPNSPRVAAVARTMDLGRTFLDGERLSVDAAIAKVRDRSRVSSRLNGNRPLRIGRPAGIQPGTKMKLIGKSGSIKVEILGMAELMILPYRCGHQRCQFRFKRLIEYRMSVQSQGGDSGAPVMLGTTLFGMHLGKTRNGIGLALCVRDVIQKNTFGRRLSLESAHNL